MKDKIEIISEGNYLGKSRRTFFISTVCFNLLHEMSLNMGLNHSSMIEIAVRHLYNQTIGPVPAVPLVTRRFGSK